MRLIQRETCLKFDFQWMLILVLGATLIATGCTMKPFKGGSFKAPSNNSEVSASVWLDSFDKAQEISAATGKPILADFTGTDWCVWCQRLRAEVFDQPEFVEWASENVVLLELDYPKRGRQSATVKSQNAKLKGRYGIDSYPTVLLIDASGNELGRTGYVKGGPDAWIPAAESLLGRTVQP